MKKKNLFVTSDLFQKKSIPQVVQNVYSVVRLAQANPKYFSSSF